MRVLFFVQLLLGVLRVISLIASLNTACIAHKVQHNSTCRLHMDLSPASASSSQALSSARSHREPTGVRKHSDSPAPLTHSPWRPASSLPSMCRERTRDKSQFVLAHVSTSAQTRTLGGSKTNVSDSVRPATPGSPSASSLPALSPYALCSVYRSSNFRANVSGPSRIFFGHRAPVTAVLMARAVVTGKARTAARMRTRRGMPVAGVGATTSRTRTERQIARTASHIKPLTRPRCPWMRSHLSLHTHLCLARSPLSPRICLPSPACPQPLLRPLTLRPKPPEFSFSRKSSCKHQRCQTLSFPCPCLGRCRRFRLPRLPLPPPLPLACPAVRCRLSPPRRNRSRFFPSPARSPSSVPWASLVN